MNGAESPRNAAFPDWTSPPAEFRPSVLWSWNGDMSPGRITTMLEGFAKRNIGGVFIHPRPGLITEYLSEKWFELWAFALHESKRLRLGCHIYDEYSFPSGFAGGHVMSGNPLFANSRLSGRWMEKPEEREDSPGLPMGTLARDPSIGVTRLVKDHAIGASGFIDLRMDSFPPSLWHAGFPMADVCRAEVTAQFLESTHAAYSARFSKEFGKSIHFVFTDEPETGTSENGFHLSQSFLEEFLSEHGYPLDSRLAELCGSCPDSPEVRHDYFVTLNRLFTSNFAKQCHDWCDARGLAFTGHFLENEWPFPRGCPSTMAAQRWMHAPGADLLGFQFACGRDNSFWLLTLKEATSIAAQCGRDEVLCESCGGGGYGFGPAEMKPLEDFLLALGVNRMAPHLAHESLAGTRKYDWPQTISDHAPWWDAFGSHSLHVGRANYLLSRGTETNRTLVLHPTTTGWLHYRPGCFHWPGEHAHAPLETLRKSHAAFLAELYSSGVDFDLGDELVMAELCDRAIESHASGAPSLKIGDRAYETVVVPAGMENILSSTVRILRDFLEDGGTVLSAGCPPAFVDGRPSPFPLDAMPGWISAGNKVIDLLRVRHPPRLTTRAGAPLPRDLMWRYSALPDGGAVVFFSNPSAGRITADVVVKGAGVTSFDTHSGVASDQEVRLNGDRVVVPLDLPPGGHALWQVSPTPPPGARRSTSLWKPVRVDPMGCEPAEPNVVALDYCDYSGPGINAPNLGTIHADNANWQAQGFEQNLWRVSIQFRRTFVDARVRESSGFVVRYPFAVSDRLATSATDIHVAVERPWLYAISCNGLPITQDGALPWFDEEMRLLPLGNAIAPGRNILELKAERFDVHAEIMPVFLRGRFHVSSSPDGFLLDTDAQWKSGCDWREEGYPFYPWQARYRFAFSLPAPGKIRVILPRFSASAAGLVIDGGEPDWAASSGKTMLFPEPFRAGAHSLEIVLAGNLQNLLGPHFSDGLPGAWSWEECPATQPPGDRYRFHPTGLSGQPIIEISE